MRSKLIILLMSVFLVACGPSDDLLESLDTAKAIEGELSEEHGLSTRVAIMRLNGRLMDVSLSVGYESMGDLAVEDVFELVEPIFTRHLGEKPELITIAVIFVNEP